MQLAEKETNAVTGLPLGPSNAMGFASRKLCVKVGGAICHKKRAILEASILVCVKICGQGYISLKTWILAPSELRRSAKSS